jgi:PleD family two-component response regulator
VVIAPGFQDTGVDERLARLRGLLRSGEAGPEIEFSVGTAALAPGGQPDAALEAADEAMYAARARR